MEVKSLNEIQFDEEYVFDLVLNEGEVVKLVIGHETYIETETEMFYYNKVSNIFKSDEGILFVMSEDNKKIIEDAFNVANRK